MTGDCSRALLRIFSYQPNPRLWKATIAARHCGVELELRGAAPEQLADWLWDFDARPLTAADRDDPSTVQVGRIGFGGTALRKTPAFLAAHPFGTVPAAFSPDGAVGIFESNSIARAVARLGAAQVGLYGDDPYQASRIDSLLDTCLVFGRDTQPWLLGLRAASVSAGLRAQAHEACASWLDGIERALLASGPWLVGSRLSLADVCFACELTMLWYERPRRAWLAAQGLQGALPDAWATRWPRVATHFATLRAHPAFAPDLEAHLARLESAPAESTP
ncbi:MAG: glutathione S-transferase family protein [Gammaproteobacteria bacterium]|nr:glutathione S-transferase family protein [Gammaproteobacteria bacterium]